MLLYASVVQRLRVPDRDQFKTGNAVAVFNVSTI
jgi:hypothetical protein